MNKLNGFYGSQRKSPPRKRLMAYFYLVVFTDNHNLMSADHTTGTNRIYRYYFFLNTNTCRIKAFLISPAILIAVPEGTSTFLLW